MTLQLLKTPAHDDSYEHKFAATADSTVQYCYIHGYRRAFVHTGHGPVVLLIHGIGDSCDTWRDIIPGLSQHYTVIAPDLLGHGRSDKPRGDYSVAGYANGMRDLMGLLGVEHCTVLGHSLGGGVAMQFAYQFPELCERLVLVSSGGVCDEVSTLLRLAAMPNAELFMPLVASARARAVTQWLCKLLQRFDADIGIDADDVMRMLGTLPDVNARRAFLRTLRSAIDWRGQAISVLDRCYLMQSIPTLVIWGARDAVIPMQHAQVANAAMANSRVEIFEGAGHFPFRTNPARFLSVLERFLEETEPAAHNVDEWRSLLRLGPADRKPAAIAQ
ncbi:MAG: hypothetical protein RL701_8081 [Pseudomonadota bacterium]